MCPHLNYVFIIFILFLISLYLTLLFVFRVAYVIPYAYTDFIDIRQYKFVFQTLINSLICTESSMLKNNRRIRLWFRVQISAPLVCRVRIFLIFLEIFPVFRMSFYQHFFYVTTIIPFLFVSSIRFRSSYNFIFG